MQGQCGRDVRVLAQRGSPATFRFRAAIRGIADVKQRPPIFYDAFFFLTLKLGKRNTAAHPSTMVVVQSQADDVVTDLVNNVVLALT